MKDRQYWIDRGKNGKQFPDLVCIGEGDNKKCLVDQLGIKSSDLGMPSFGSLTGDSPSVNYYLKQSKFDELFPKNIMKYVIKAVSPEHSKVIQERLFELGIGWVLSGQKVLIKETTMYLRNGNIYLDKGYGDEEITLNDLYTRDLFPKSKPIEVKLNSSYTAGVHPDKIVVGCQTFSMEAFEELRAAVDKIKA